MQTTEIIELKIRVYSDQTGSNIADEMTEAAKQILELIGKGYWVDNSHTELIKAQDKYLCLRFQKD